MGDTETLYSSAAGIVDIRLDTKMNYHWNFARIYPYSEAFLSGTLTTLTLTLVVIAIGTFAGILLGVLMRNQLMRVVLYPAIDIVRALPPLVLILIFYYTFTRQIIGVTVSAFWVCVLAMSTNLAAFTSDLVRAAFLNAPTRSVEGARALGMSERQIVIYIISPHVLREIIPAMTLLYIATLKMSSLASIISVREVVYTAQTVIAVATRSLEAWTVVGLIYIALVVPATYGARQVERWAHRASMKATEKC